MHDRGELIVYWAKESDSPQKNHVFRHIPLKMEMTKYVVLKSILFWLKKRANAGARIMRE